MKFYICPTFSKKKFYYSCYSSFLFVLLGLYFIISKKAGKILQYGLILMGLISMVHHCRSFTDDYQDIFRYIDMICANLLALIVFFDHPTKTTFFLGCFVLLLYLYIQNICRSPVYKSLFHALFHTIMCLIIFMLYST